jgi:flagellar biogenesis protein FliO
MSNRYVNCPPKWTLAVVLVFGFLAFTADVALSASPDDSSSQPASDQAASKSLLQTKPEGRPLRLHSDDSGPSTSGLLQQMLALVIVILLLGGVCWLVIKKFLPRLRTGSIAKGRRLKLLETMYLSPRQSVYLLRADGRTLVLAGGRDGLRMLADVTGQDDDSAAFQEEFQRQQDKEGAE